MTGSQRGTIEPDGLGKRGDRGRSGNRLFVEAVLWVVRTGRRWPDIPGSFGNCSSIYTRVCDGTVADVFAYLVEAVSDEPDMEYAMTLISPQTHPEHTP